MICKEIVGERLWGEVVGRGCRERLWGEVGERVGKRV